MLNNYALLIGVEDYRIYDRSMDLPAGTSDVAGALDDARTFFRQCLAMGFAPERIRVLMSPRLSPQALGPEATEATVGEATRDAMIASVTWLCEALDGPEPAAGLITFSGHGMQSDGVLLCPSDTTGSLEQAINISAVARQIGSGATANNLTVLLDCCHAEVGEPGTGGLPARMRERTTGSDAPTSDVVERVIAACRREQASVSSLFGGARMGAFTWAITSVMGQWEVVEEDGVAQLGIAYGELTGLTHALLGVLAFKQVPTLSGPPGVALLPFLHPGSMRDKGEGEIAVKPDASRERRQLDGGWYTLDDIARKNVQIAQIFATAEYEITLDGSRATRNTEYWYINQDALAGLDQSSSLQIDFNPLELGGSYRSPAYASTQSLELAENVTWIPRGDTLPTPPDSASFMFCGSDATSTLTIWLQLIRTARSTLSGIGWYSDSDRNVEPWGEYRPSKAPHGDYYAVTWSSV